MPTLADTLTILLRDIAQFTTHAGGITLRSYQIPVARAIIDSIVHHRGSTIAVMFPRQSGKNELQAQIEAYLLTLFSNLDAEMVKASPTWKPQSVNAMNRLERSLRHNLITRNRWRKTSGYIYRIGSASITFLSAEPKANVAGATANVLLEVDEAQDVQIAKFDKDFLPMCAATNATRVFFGTAWTKSTLLARELSAADRAFRITADQVGYEVPAYRKFVDGQIQRMGRNHPLVRTQYFCEELDDTGGMFPPQRRALMQGSHAPATLPEPGHVYAFLIDVAGEDEAQRAPGADLELANTARDSTALTIVDVELTTIQNPLIHAPTYRAVARFGWKGTRHTALFGQILALADLWGPSWTVIDATGVGAGLAGFLGHSLPQVLPVIFNAPTKSRIGWDFLAVIETGRWRDYAPHDPQAREFWAQLPACEFEAGAYQQIKWGVPNNARHPDTGELLHDDWILSAALVAELDIGDWGPSGPGTSHLLAAPDPIADADAGDFR